MLVRHGALDRCLVTGRLNYGRRNKTRFTTKIFVCIFLCMASSFKAGDTNNNQNALKAQISY
jgi:hypothetical protein